MPKLEGDYTCTCGKKLRKMKKFSEGYCNIDCYNKYEKENFSYIGQITVKESYFNTEHRENEFVDLHTVHLPKPRMIRF